MISVGDIYNYDFSFTQDQVIKFAEISGDHNPIHLDDEYAANSIFKKRILHGFLGGSVFSKVFGTLYPGEGTIYLKQSLIFYKPMYVNVQYVAKFRIIETIKDKNRALVETQILDEEGAVVTNGEALIQNERLYV